jgi:hypothetical protein
MKIDELIIEDSMESEEGEERYGRWLKDSRGSVITFLSILLAIVAQGIALFTKFYTIHEIATDKSDAMFNVLEIVNIIFQIVLLTLIYFWFSNLRFPIKVNINRALKYLKHFEGGKINKGSIESERLVKLAGLNLKLYNRYWRSFWAANVVLYILLLIPPVIRSLNKFQEVETDTTWPFIAINITTVALNSLSAIFLIMCVFLLLRPISWTHEANKIKEQIEMLDIKFRMLLVVWLLIVMVHGAMAVNIKNKVIAGMDQHDFELVAKENYPLMDSIHSFRKYRILKEEWNSIPALGEEKKNERALSQLSVLLEIKKEVVQVGKDEQIQHTYKKMKLKNLTAYSETLSGLLLCVAIALLVAALDSKLVNIDSTLISILYFYAAVQPLFGYFSGDSPSIKIMVLYIVLLLKLQFYLIVSFAIKTHRLTDLMLVFPFLKDMVEKEGWRHEKNQRKEGLSTKIATRINKIFKSHPDKDKIIINNLIINISGDKDEDFVI